MSNLLGDINTLEELGDWQSYFTFAKESNSIEGIHDESFTTVHADALKEFVSAPKVTLKRMEKFVERIEPKAFLRTDENHRVVIGGQVAPSPIESIPKLTQLLQLINRNEIHPFPAHTQYEYLHPFMGGNGRSGRALWLWQMKKFFHWNFQLPFLHKFYYQSLDFHTRQIAFFGQG